MESIGSCRDEKKIEKNIDGLDMKVKEHGKNFSVGEKQLVCMARAILKNSKIIVLDEATASVDYETDNVIQKTIRTQFKNSTVITVAHRLNTIMDYDKVCVLDQGELIEFDNPKKLASNQNSFFYNFVHPSQSSKIDQFDE